MEGRAARVLLYDSKSDVRRVTSLGAEVKVARVDNCFLDIGMLSSKE